MLAQKFLRIIGKNEITLWDGAYSPLCLMFQWNKQSLYDKFYKTPATPIFEIIKGREALQAFNNQYYKDYAIETFQLYLDKTKKIKGRMEKSKALGLEIEELYFKTQKLKLEELSEQQLLDILHTNHALLSELEIITICVETFDKETVQFVMSDEKELIEQMWKKVTEPTFVPFEMRRLEQILEKEKDLPIEKKLQYIFTDYFSTKNTEEIKESLNKIIGSEEELKKNQVNLKNFKKEHQRKTEESTAWLKSLNLKERKLAEYVQMVMEIRDWRKDPISQAQSIFFNVGSELFSRAGIDKENLPYVLPQELELGLGWLVQERESISKRKKGMAVLLNTDGRCEIQLVDDIAKVSEKIKKAILEVHDGDMIKGQIGFDGVVKGIAKIVTDANCADHFREGDVLVAGMTRPEFLPLMRKASAFVTDEGGITCHAAIVAREMKKPCIIGTKIATKILKDGDLVEVDANKGIVRIVK